MLKFLRTQEHIERGHEQYASVKAMFTVYIYYVLSLF
jgi:hypothetical protein